MNYNILKKDVSTLFNQLRHNVRFRTTVYATTIFLSSLTAIYAFKSDRIDTETRTYNRVSPSPKTDNAGGLSINGLSIDYYTTDKTLFSIDDFVSEKRNSINSVNIQFTYSREHPANSVYMTFEKNGKKILQSFDFEDNLFKTETKELSYWSGMYGNGKLNSIKIEEKEKIYSVDFK